MDSKVIIDQQTPPYYPPELAIPEEVLCNKGEVNTCALAINRRTPTTSWACQVHSTVLPYKVNACASYRQEEVGWTLGVKIPRYCKHSQKGEPESNQDRPDPPSEQDGGGAYTYFHVVSFVLTGIDSVYMSAVISGSSDGFALGKRTIHHRPAVWELVQNEHNMERNI